MGLTADIAQRYLAPPPNAAGEDGETIEVVCPSTEQVAYRVPVSTIEALDASVEAARTAWQRGWRRTTLEQRIAVIRDAAKRLEDQQHDIARMVTTEVGMPIVEARRSVAKAIGRMADAFPAAARVVTFEQLRRDSDGTALMVRGPVGVVAALTPWNTAFGGAVLKVIPALLAGCGVVLKPSPIAPADPYYLAEALSLAGLPDGLLSIVQGGPEIGQRLVTHPGVNMVTLTGSSAVGADIAAEASRRYKRTVLECGGKSAAIVLDDADLGSTVDTITSAALTMSGQYCRSLSRVLVPRRRSGEFVAALAERMGRRVVGDPYREETQVGPLVTSRQRELAESYVRLGLEEGAELVSGGTPSGLPQPGWYFRPTLFAGVTNNMRIAREELFAPIACVIEYSTEDEAIDIANDSDYGLSGAVFSESDDHALAIARQVETGLIGINTQGARECVPCSGLKRSGLGDEHGPEGFLEFLRTTAVLVPEALALRLQEAGTPMDDSMLKVSASQHV